MFSYGFCSSTSSATVTPSLVTVGDPHDLSSTAFLPRGPSVLLTARANLVTPSLMCANASSSKASCLAIRTSSACRCLFGTSLAAPQKRENKNLCTIYNKTRATARSIPAYSQIFDLKRLAFLLRSRRTAPFHSPVQTDAAKRAATAKRVPTAKRAATARERKKK